MGGTEPLIEVLADADALSHRVADWLTGEAAQTEGRFAIALSGGSTPKHLYQILAQPPHRDRFPWARTHFFWGDERFVPHDHPDSNYRMAREALIDHVPIPPENVHPVPTEGTPDEAAAAYEATLRAFYGTAELDPARNLFDVVLLGVGSDGHTASLFPGTAVLEERNAWVKAVVGVKAEPRITLTYPAIASSGTVAFLAEGEGKREIVARVRSGDPTLPAARVTTRGRLRWFLDRTAAGSQS
jgi:6-phosphogluconolactonase